MADRAHVTSFEALEAFRAALIVYLTKARPALDNVSDDVLRTRLWLQNDQRTHWEGQVRRRAKALEQAQQALFSAGMANLREPSSAEQAALHRARRALTEAEDKLRRVKQWGREFENRVEPLAKQLEKLRTTLTNDMPKAVTYLAQTVKTLSEYANLVAPSISAGPAEPSGQDPAADGAASAEPASSTPPPADPAPSGGAA
jgi:hypothetical protein